MKFLQRFTKLFGVVIIILFCALSIFFSIIERELQSDQVRETISYASNFENRFYDWRMKALLDPNKKNEEVVLARIDDDSLQKIGSWPIPRTVWAELMLKLKAFGAKIVGFDVMFPEPAQVCNETSPDEIFKNAIADFQSIEGNKVIMAYTLAEHYEEIFKETPEDLYNFMMDSQQSGGAHLSQKYVSSHTYPIKKLLEPTPDMGYISMLEDADGVFRHYQLVANVDTLYMPSLGMKAFESFTGKKTKLNIGSSGTATLEYDDVKLFINNNGETKIRWLGGVDNYDSVSIYEILSGDPNKDEKLKARLNNKIIFIGSTAIGAHDLRNTPIDSKTPGVYAHMNMVHMLMHKYFYQSLEDSVKISLIGMAIGLAILIGVMMLNNAILDIVTLIILMTGVWYVDLKYFLPEGYELRLFFVMNSFILTYSWVTFLNFYQASKEKKQIKGTFARYVAPAIVNEMLNNPEKLKVGGEKKDITCLFSDVRDFTSISEKLTATELSRALNKYMGAMTDIVFDTMGTLDKYIGDAIVAYWGAPVDLPDHPNLAVGAAVKMLEALPAINEQFKAEGLPEFKIGLGLNSGECSLGNMGSDKIFSYTALGDNMNLGARLESLCKHYGAQIIISEFTLARIDQNKFVTRHIDNVKVKGKTKPVSIYEVLYNGHRLMADQAMLNTYKEAYKKYIEMDFKAALKMFNEFLTKYSDDKPANRLKAMCEQYIDVPPAPGEDHTITTMKEK
jgi:adenylate cyclase